MTAPQILRDLAKELDSTAHEPGLSHEQWWAMLCAYSKLKSAADYLETPKPGWLERQFDNVDANVAAWPDYMRRAANLD